MTLPYLPQAVVFDMDGVIFDTEALYEEAFGAAVEAGAYSVPKELHRRTLGVTWVQSRAIYLDHMGSDFPVDAFFNSMVEQFDLLAATRLALKPGVVELLDLLDCLSIPRCIATSSTHITAQSHLSAHGLADRFHGVIGHGDYALSKPSPDPFLAAAKRLNVEPAFCLALEDSFNGVRSASAAGMMTYMIPDLLETSSEIEELCMGVASDLHAIHRLILSAPKALDQIDR